MQRIKLAPQELKRNEAIRTNDEAFAAWQQYTKARVSVFTFNNYSYDVRMFLGALERPAWEYGQHDLWTYLDLYLQRCRHHQWGAPRFADEGGAYCRKRLDLNECGAKCPAFEARTAITTQKHLQAVITFYDFLVRHGLTPYNFVRDVKREYARENRARPVKEKVVPSMDELRALLRATPGENRRALYFFLAKTGCRISEAIRIPLDLEHVDLENGWARIPSGGKRRGNPFVVIDAELKRELTQYLKWRRGRAKSDYLFVNYAGRGFNPQDTWAINKVMRRDLKRANITGSRVFSPHSLRHFFSDYVKREGVDPYWWNVLRGDVPSGNEATYVHPTLEDIQSQYVRFAPRIQSMTLP